MTLSIELPRDTYPIFSGKRRRLLADVIGATTEKERKKKWEIIEGPGKIDENGLFQAAILMEDEQEPDTLIRVSSEFDPSINNNITVTTRQAPAMATAPDQTKVVTIVLAVISAIGIFVSLFKFPLGMAILGCVLLLTAMAFTEIRTPFLGFLFVRGKLIGKLLPGWYLIIPVIWNIEKKSTKLIRADMKESMYVLTKTPIDVRALCYYQLVDPQKAVTISDEEIQKKVEGLMSSQTKTAVGKETFQDLISHQAALENTITMEIDNEIDRNGYVTTTFELVDLKEEVESVAVKKKTIGAADAVVIGKKTKAITDNVGDKWQSAIAVGARDLAEALAKLIGKRANQNNE